jgi:type IV secretory pathway VirB2 component (pilin)
VRSGRIAVGDLNFPRTANDSAFLTPRSFMKKSRDSHSQNVHPAPIVLFAFVGLLLAAPLFAQSNSPWENAVSVLQQAFTSTIARGLSLVAIVVSGLTFAFARSKPMWAIA